MAEKTKRPKYIAVRTRRILGENVSRLMHRRYAGERDRVTALHQDSGVARSTIQRIIQADAIGASVDTITQLANALHVEAFELLKPQAGDDAA